jgi:hypothetical protein
MPILASYYRALKRGAIPNSKAEMPDSGFKWMAAGVEAGDTISDDTRVSFFTAFNYTIDE